jgi:hypothetical protein
VGRVYELGRSKGHIVMRWIEHDLRGWGNRNMA